MNAKLPQVGELARLLKALKPQIQDNYRAYAEATLPSMRITIGWDDEPGGWSCQTGGWSWQTGGWSWQTGDNSFTGSAYGYPHWAVVDLYRRSNTVKLARDIRAQLSELAYV